MYVLSAPGCKVAYVGKSKTPDKRFREHMRQAKNGTHPNAALRTFLLQRKDAFLVTWEVDGDALNAEAAMEARLKKAGWQLLNAAPCGHFWQRSWRRKHAA